MTTLSAIPVSIVSGYRGAGKTTLVNNALRKANGLKLAILVNEFGNLAIDEDLIIAQDDNMISLAGGCICCSYGNDMLLSLKELAALDSKPDQIILEASGVAIPSAIESSVSLIDECYTESIVSIIDCEQIEDQLNDKYIADTVLSQIESADLILANKAEPTSWVAYRAVVISKIITGVLCGISSGPLFSYINPVKACKTGSIAGFVLIGPF